MPHTVLIVSATAPLPVDSGKRVVLSGLLDYFVDRLGPRNVHYAMPVDDAAPPPEFPGVLHRLTKPTPADQLAALRQFLTDRAYSFQEAALNSKRIREEVRMLVDSLRPTVEIYDTLRLAQHAPAKSQARTRVLYLDDLFSERYDRMLRLAAKTELTVDPLGQFVSYLPPHIRSFARRPRVYRTAMRIERDRLRRRESEIVHGFDTNLLINSDEVELLRQRSGSPAVERFNPLLPSPAAVARNPSTPPEFVFVGRLNIPHNDDAICSFLRNVIGPLKRKCPGVVLRIIGKDPSQTLLRLAEQHSSNVIMEGFVEDLGLVFSRATATIAPLRFGSGVKIKLLEALARGVPMVATSIAAEGIPLDAHGAAGCLVEDDLGRWPQLLVDLVDRKYNERLSTGSREFYARTYGRDVVVRQYDALFALSAVPRHDDNEQVHTEIPNA